MNPDDLFPPHDYWPLVNEADYFRHDFFRNDGECREDFMFTDDNKTLWNRGIQGVVLEFQCYGLNPEHDRKLLLSWRTEVYPKILENYFVREEEIYRETGGYSVTSDSKG